MKTARKFNKDKKELVKIAGNTIYIENHEIMFKNE